MNIDNFKFKNSIGADLAGRVYGDDENTVSGVIFSHGLFSTKDGYKITRLAESIVGTGNRLMTFDFTFAGESPGNITDISVLQEVDDLRSAVHEFRRRGIDSIHLMGSSMGAVVSILAESMDNFSFKSLILIAAPVDLFGIIPGMTPEDADKLEENGVTEISGIPVKNSFFKELSGIDMIEGIKKINCPVLIFHGRDDDVVDFKNFETLTKNLTVDYDQEVIDDGDHHLTRDQDIALMERRIGEWLSR